MGPQARLQKFARTCETDGHTRNRQHVEVRQNIGRRRVVQAELHIILYRICESWLSVNSRFDVPACQEQISIIRCVVHRLIREMRQRSYAYELQDNWKKNSWNEEWQGKTKQLAQ